MGRRDQERRERCLRKIRYATWDEAQAATLAVWFENPRSTDTNPCAPYPCDQPGERHYHIGHLRFGRGSRKAS